MGVGSLSEVVKVIMTDGQVLSGWKAVAGAIAYVQYIPRNMHTVFALLCFVVFIYWLVFPYRSGLHHWHCGNLTIAPVPAKQPWWIWINTSCEFIMNDCITITKQSTTKPCVYFLGYIVIHDGSPKQRANYETSAVHPTCAIIWQAFDGNVMPENAIIGGVRYGVTLYIARTTVSFAGPSAYVGEHLNAKLRKMFYVDSTTSIISPTTGIKILMMVWQWQWQWQWNNLYCQVTYRSCTKDLSKEQKWQK